MRNLAINTPPGRVVAGHDLRPQLRLWTDNGGWA
ncbi:hypothetical protein TNCT_85081, partial [Trichonephila clavata]